MTMAPDTLSAGTTRHKTQGICCVMMAAPLTVQGAQVAFLTPLRRGTPPALARIEHRPGIGADGTPAARCRWCEAARGLLWGRPKSPTPWPRNQIDVTSAGTSSDSDDVNGLRNMRCASCLSGGQKTPSFLDPIAQDGLEGHRWKLPFPAHRRWSDVSSVRLQGSV